ncbi:WxL protein peptidoglycan domain-containing protein [Actinoplanes sp. RD1]|uniref:WxL protein peptidoglycan domain-containing protein n=1 Tax=Actinoplanes sp. RD1 TaxID=3064538 RepID=UPI002741A2F2|nr:DUF916 domain-containing protein [Actinoplanes sp. RD1]
MKSTLAVLTAGFCAVLIPAAPAAAAEGPAPQPRAQSRGKRHRHVSLIAAALLAVVVLTAAPPAAAAPGDALTWSVAPSGPEGPNGRPALDYKLDPGAKVTDHVAVTNHSDRPLTLGLYASDAFTTGGGGFDLLAGAARPTDAGSWITLGRGTVELPKSSRVIVPFTVTVPGNATPGDHAAGVVASLAAAGTDAHGNQVTVDHRVGTRVHLRVTGPLQPALSITDVTISPRTSWNPFQLPEVTAAFTIRNTGNVRLSAQPSARARGPFSLGSVTAAGTALPEVLPGGTVATTVRLKRIPPLFREQVTLTVLPAASDGRPIDPIPVRVHSQHVLWLLPWPQLALLALAALLVTGRLFIRRRRRRRVAQAIAAAEERGRAQALHRADHVDPERSEASA